MQKARRRTRRATVEPAGRRDVGTYRSSHDRPSGRDSGILPASSAVMVVDCARCWGMVPSTRARRGTRAFGGPG
ncbi:hypothetical protein NGM37_10970, partial [Streptomyces sp. TRM76130]|nr:hypothetical protein [Streptomyces sp. TRM76130]